MRETTPLRRDGAYLFVAAHVDIPVVGAAIRQAVNQPWIAVIRKDHGLIAREQGVELSIVESMWMFGLGLEPHQVEDIER
jgi:hypothetical protein